MPVSPRLRAALVAALAAVAALAVAGAGAVVDSSTQVTAEPPPPKSVRITDSPQT